MSDQDQNQSSSSEAAASPESSPSPSPTPEAPPPAPPADSPAKAVFDFKAEVAQGIVEGSPGIRKQVVDELVKDELTARKVLAVKAVKRREEVYKELMQLTRPPEKKFRLEKDPNGVHQAKEVEVFLDSKQVQELKKKQEELAKIDKAISAAFKADKPDYEPLKKLN